MSNGNSVFIMAPSMAFYDGVPSDILLLNMTTCSSDYTFIIQHR